MEETLREIEALQVLHAVQQPVGVGGICSRLELPEPHEPRHVAVDRLAEQILKSVVGRIVRVCRQASTNLRARSSFDRASGASSRSQSPSSRAAWSEKTGIRTAGAARADWLLSFAKGDASEAVKLTPGAAEAATTHVRLVAERLALVNRQLDQVRRELDGLVHQLAEAAPADDPNASAEDEPSSKALPDAAILLSLPGIGAKVLAALLAEGSDAVERRDYYALRCLCRRRPHQALGAPTPVRWRRP